MNPWSKISLIGVAVFAPLTIIAGLYFDQRNLARDSTATPVIWIMILGVPALSLSAVGALIGSFALFKRKAAGGAVLLIAAVLAVAALCAATILFFRHAPFRF